MRPLKFRAWDTEEKRMIRHEEQKLVLVNCMDSFGADLHYPSPRQGQKPGSHSLEDRWFDDESCFDWASAHLITGRFQLMQFTGVQDRNDQEIYEGDIVEGPSYKDPIAMKHQTTVRGVVQFQEDDGFLGSGFSGRFELPDGYRTFPRLKNCIVIGNIHQHPLMLLWKEKEVRS